MNKISASIDNQTRVELYAVLCCVPFAVAAVLWAASIDAKASAAEEGLKELKPVFLELVRETSSLKTEIRNLNESIRKQSR